ncbi:uncharacterized protein LOC130150370 [Falco biarmicus]|uniref:uncharacterized protein LOC130150370 n=2 Tax=Falco TaxID=8952 RepID=UPI0024BC04F1|nr:uncharacterized protein LOC130150370 [Falco biarmicus]
MPPHCRTPRHRQSPTALLDPPGTPDPLGTPDPPGTLDPPPQLDPLTEPDTLMLPDPPGTASDTGEDVGLHCASPPLPPVTVTSFSGTIRLYHSAIEGSPPAPPGRPLLLLLPWLGARARGLARYLALYLRHGMDVLVVGTTVCHILWPWQGQRLAGQLLRLLDHCGDGGIGGGGGGSNGDGSSGCGAGGNGGAGGSGGCGLATRPLLVHAISAGAYTFAQVLLLLHHQPQQCQRLAPRFRGIIYDSLVTGGFGDMAQGIAGTVGTPSLRALVRAGAWLYLRVLGCWGGQEFERARGAFASPPLRCPLLLFYCLDDGLSQPAVLRALLQGWRAQGIRAHAWGWPHSRHAGHLRQHPAEYCRTLLAFLRSLEGPPPTKARL